ncbi:DUF2306 domain-containing protein [Paenibacillus athensensis]|uniref:DUF2306 domain-containing protein n=1 Tax=Paenibacillus athensensis TaxID=1967502 RepID=A0A4Y8QAV7_9BACL|nr:DUF2306 domain-containing protein [Paenibacillus athensensis]MCD1260114.1 DUF2306 domain-containing protein [Paenibacillus athensensis]
MRKFGIGLITALAFVVAAYAIVQYGFFHPKYAGLVQEKLRKPDFHLTPWVYVLYAHIATACLAIVIGPFQLFRKQRSAAARRRHRMLGIIYVASIMLSSLVSVYLSLYATGGWVAGVGFFTLDLLWAASTLMGVIRIIQGKADAHRRWMLRSYALTLAAVGLRLYLFPLVLLFDGDFEAAYRVVAWLCWIPNLAIAEIWIRRQRKGE